MKKILKYSTLLIAGCILASGCAKSVPIRSQVCDKLRELKAPYIEVINNLEITADYDYDYGLHGLSYSKLYVKVKNKDTGNVLEMVDVGELKPIDNFFPLGHDLVFNDVDGALLNDETLNYEKRKNVEQKFDEALRKILPGLEKKLLECEKNMNKTIDEDFRL